MAHEPRLGSLSLGLRVISRQLRSQPAVVLTILVAVLVGAVLLGAAPRLTERVSEDDLRATATEPVPAVRNVRVETRNRIGVGPPEDPMARIRETGESFAVLEFPDSVSSVISDSYFVVDTARLKVEAMPGEELSHPFDTFIRYRYQEGIEDRITFLKGEMPTPQERVPMLVGHECPADPEERADLLETLEQEGAAGTEFDCTVDDIPHIQVAVSQQTATDMGLDIGVQTLLRPDPTDILVLGASGNAFELMIVMSISGIIDLTDPGEEYWYGDPALHWPSIDETADFRIIRATGLMNPDDYALVTRTFSFIDRQHTWRHFVDADLVAEASALQLEADLRLLESEFSPLASGHETFRVITRLSDLIDDHLAQRSQTLVMLATSTAGLFSLVIATVFLLAVLMTTRQRDSIVLIRNRGASAGQLVLTRIYEGVVLVVPAAVIGYLIAEIALPQTASLLPYRATVALVGFGVLAVVAATFPLIRQRLGSLQTENPDGTARTGGRLVSEMVVVALAAGAVVLLRRRGPGADPVVEGFDILLAAGPTLIALAAGLLTLRIYPYVIRFFAWLASKMRGLVGFVGFRRILQQPAAARLPVLVILICISTAAFASVAGTTLAEGQEVSSWQAVGGDYAVKGPGPHFSVPPSVDLTELESVETLALGTTFANARALTEKGSFPTGVLAVDAAAHARVTAGTAGDLDLPEFITSPSVTDDGTTDSPIPAIVSSTWPGSFALTVGDVFQLDLGRLQPILVVEEIRDRYPDLDERRPFVIVNRDALLSFSGVPFNPTVAYLRAPETAGLEIEEAVPEQSSNARLISRYETLSTVTSDPFVAWVGTGLGIVFTFAVVLAVIAAISSLALASATRRRDLGYLRTMGLTFRQARIMTFIEQFPAIIVATLAGVAVGAGSAAILEPVLGFDAFTGNLVPTEMHIEWATIIGGTLVLTGALAAAIVIFGLISRREDLGQTLRVGDE